jgi:hypothetical protein
LLNKSSYSAAALGVTAALDMNLATLALALLNKPTSDWPNKINLRRFPD